MEIIGIICEYNPFHNGHIHHISEIKKKYPDSLIVLALNGYFLERGEISLISKYDKALIALKNNVDIVLELPVIYGTQSADNFAYAAVKILNYLNVTHIIFGSELNDIDLIKTLAEEQSLPEYNNKIKEYLDKGINYPTALSKALKTKVILESNDLLALSYVKAINQINNKIIPESIQRTNSYLDTKDNTDIISAMNIRNKLKKNINIKKYLPKESYELINNVNEELYFNLIKTIILTNDNLNEYLDVDEGIEYRLKEKILTSNNLNEFIENVKTKRYTYNKINRMLIHILLGIKKDINKNKIEYIRILGFNKNGKKYLNQIKKNLPKDNKNNEIYKYELKASIIYDMLTNNNEYKKDLANKPIIY